MPSLQAEERKNNPSFKRTVLGLSIFSLLFCLVLVSVLCDWMPSEWMLSSSVPNIICTICIGSAHLFCFFGPFALIAKANQLNKQQSKINETIKELIGWVIKIMALAWIVFGACWFFEFSFWFFEFPLPQDLVLCSAMALCLGYLANTIATFVMDAKKNENQNQCIAGYEKSKKIVVQAQTQESVVQNSQDLKGNKKKPQSSSTNKKLSF